VFGCVLLPAGAAAQSPPPPSPSARPLSQALSAGFALTTGNKDTSTFNLGYDLLYDPKRRNQVKFAGLFLRGKTDGELTGDRLALDGRDEFELREHLFAFGQLQYLRDQFKDIDYLVSPTVGLGYRLTDNGPTRLSLDAGLGAVWEKSPIEEEVLQTSAAITVAQKLSQQISSTTALTQSLTALYKTEELSDALYTFGAAVTASMTMRTQLKVEVVDSFKTRVPDDIGNNDVAVIVGLVFRR
jgi:putative salt-induced outer membrane protein YdiY